MYLLGQVLVTDHYGTVHKMTAKELKERIEYDSKRSDYNWIAPAKNLVSICKSPGFPEDYSLFIRVAILNCFANIEHRANNYGDRYYTKADDAEAVQYCYNSLYGSEDESAIAARKRFLTEMIVTATYTNLYDPHYHPGPTYKKLREDFRNSKFEEYIGKQNIDFKELQETLKAEFIAAVKKSDESGDFDEDEKKDDEEWKDFYKRLHNMLK